MNWEDYVKKGEIRPDSIDKQRIISLIKMSKNRIEFLSKTKMDSKNASILLSNYYESLREICESIINLHRLKIYSHEAISIFLSRQLKDYNASELFDKYRRYRNRVNYYGEEIPYEICLQGKEDILSLIEGLKKKYLMDYKD